MFFINNISTIVSVIRKIAPPSCVITLATGVATSPIKNFETHHTTKERLTIKSQAEMRGKVRKI